VQFSTDDKVNSKNSATEQWLSGSQNTVFDWHRKAQIITNYALTKTPTVFRSKVCVACYYRLKTF